MIEKRSIHRQPSSEKIQSVAIVLVDREVSHLKLDLQLFDVTSKGVGFLSTYPLQPSHVLILKCSNERDIVSIVMWSNKNNGNYRIGAQYA